MKLSLERLVHIESRLSGRVARLDVDGHSGRADIVDAARRRVQRIRERRLLEQDLANTKETV